MFQKAQRKQVKIKLALTGPSGSGKTMSALLLASGLVEKFGGKIAVIDTENASASLYAGQKGLPEFDILEIDQPYTVEKYRQGIHAAIQAGYSVLVVDSLSHAWAGEGGLLSKKESLDQRGGNSYTNWASITKEHEIFKASLLNSDIHLVATMRSKQDYSIEKDDRGKSTIKKVGLAPVQRDGVEYEFTTVFDIAMNHEAQVSKDRTNLFDGKLFKINRNTGVEIAEWILGGSKTDESNQGTSEITRQIENKKEETKQTQETKAEEKKASLVPGKTEKENLLKIAKKNNWLPNSVAEYMVKKYQVMKLSELDRDEYEELCATVSSTSYTNAMGDQPSFLSQEDVP